MSSLVDHSDKKNLVICNCVVTQAVNSYSKIHEWVLRSSFLGFSFPILRFTTAANAVTLCV